MSDEDDPSDDSLDAIAPDETPDASDPKSIQRQKQKRKFVEDVRGDYWRDQMASPVGRMVLWELLQACGTFVDTFAATPAGFPDANATWFHLGQRNIGDRLYKSLLKHDPVMVRQMHAEYDPELMEIKPKRRPRTEHAF